MVLFAFFLSEWRKEGRVFLCGLAEGGCHRMCTSKKEGSFGRRAVGFGGRFHLLYSALCALRLGSPVDVWFVVIGVVLGVFPTTRLFILFPHLREWLGGIWFVIVCLVLWVNARGRFAPVCILTT